MQSSRFISSGCTVGFRDVMAACEAVPRHSEEHPGNSARLPHSQRPNSFFKSFGDYQKSDVQGASVVWTFRL